ncbi:hypothetical protein B0J12DRAFT_382261 [Macrophomina phaseolina]|uniref:Uncharacterized protein n=1 Tax=Macrophomina phaseolina TaxID=35725 RepID=A0ABQ8GKW8_9PEZI|nr:hypothetical protein B0J12DRAFT_382261 [Macrophomina phaseolina]
MCAQALSPPLRAPTLTNAAAAAKLSGLSIHIDAKLTITCPGRCPVAARADENNLTSAAAANNPLGSGVQQEGASADAESSNRKPGEVLVAAAVHTRVNYQMKAGYEASFRGISHAAAIDSTVAPFGNNSEEPLGESISSSFSAIPASLGSRPSPGGGGPGVRSITHINRTGKSDWHCLRKAVKKVSGGEVMGGGRLECPITPQQLAAARASVARKELGRRQKQVAQQAAARQRRRQKCLARGGTGEEFERSEAKRASEMGKRRDAKVADEMAALLGGLAVGEGGRGPEQLRQEERARRKARRQRQKTKAGQRRARDPVADAMGNVAVECDSAAEALGSLGRLAIGGGEIEEE